MALMTTGELARALDVRPITVRRMVKDGRIPEKYYLRTTETAKAQLRFNGTAIIRYLLKANKIPKAS